MVDRLNCRVRGLDDRGSELDFASRTMVNQIVEVSQALRLSTISATALLADALILGLHDIDPDAAVDWLTGTLLAVRAEDDDREEVAHDVRVAAIQRLAVAAEALAAAEAGRVS